MQLDMLNTIQVVPADIQQTFDTNYTKKAIGPKVATFKKRDLLFNHAVYFDLTYFEYKNYTSYILFGFLMLLLILNGP